MKVSISIECKCGKKETVDITGLRGENGEVVLDDSLCKLNSFKGIIYTHYMELKCLSCSDEQKIFFSYY